MIALGLQRERQEGLDDSAVKNPVCSSRGPGCEVQHPHDCSQPSVTPVPVDLMFHGHCTHVLHTHTYMEAKYLYI